MFTALLPTMPIPNPSMPFGLAVILHRVVFTVYSMMVGSSRFAAVNILMLLIGAIVHTATSTTLSQPSLPGYNIMLSGMAFLCFFYELQYSTYGKTRKEAGNSAEDSDPIVFTGVSLILLRLTTIIIMPIAFLVTLGAVAILVLALLIVLAPLL